MPDPRMTVLVVTLVLLASGCPTGRYAHEGDDRGECADNADNDRDGHFDCDDPDCDNSPDCDDDDTGYDNVQACEEWVGSFSCGDYYLSGVVDCSVYSETVCDVSDYFDCLAENTDCDEDLGIVDTTGWTSCADLASCD